jgi:hypothetical protein
MSYTDMASAEVVAVLLPDGWHQVVPGSFAVGALVFCAEVDPGRIGYRFEEADPGRPYRPASLAGPLDSIIAVRQITPAAGRISDLDRARAAHGGHRADLTAPHRSRAGRAVGARQAKT